MLDIDDLFHPWKDVDVFGRTLRVRALSDFEMQLVGRAALAAGGRTLRALRDPATDDYLALIEPLGVAADSELRDLIVRASQRRLTQEATAAHPYTYQPFPDGATDEERAAVLEQREQTEKARREKIAALVEQKTQALSQSLETKDLNWLRNEAVRLAQDVARLTAYTEELAWQSVFHCTETVDGQPAFSSVDVVRKLGRQALDKLWLAFQEVNDLDPLASKSPSSTA